MFMALALVAAPGLLLFQPEPAGAAQARPLSFSTADAVPADAFAYIVATTDQQSTQWRLAQEVLARAGLEDEVTELLGAGWFAAQGKSIAPDRLMGGEVALALTHDAATLLHESVWGGRSDAIADGVAVIIRAGDPDAAWTMVESFFRPRPDGAYLGADIFQYGHFSVARAGEFILVAPHRENLEPLIATVDGWIAPISQLPEFAAARAALPKPALLFSFVNRASLSQADFGEFSMVGAQLGVNGYSAQTIAADPAGFRLDSVTLPVDGQPFLPPLTASEAQLPETAPADAIALLSGSNLYATGILSTARAYMAARYPALAEITSISGYDIEDDLFRQFTGEFGGWFSLDTGNAMMQPDDLSAMLAFDLADPDAARSALTQIVLDRPETSNSDGVSIASMPVDGTPMFAVILDQVMPEAHPVLFGVRDDRLLIRTTGADGAEAALQPPAEPLVRSSAYRDAMALLPKAQDGMLYVNLRRAVALARKTGLLPIEGGPNLSRFTTFAAVSYRDGGLYRTSAILLVER